MVSGVLPLAHGRPWASGKTPLIKNDDPRGRVRLPLAHGRPWASGNTPLISTLIHIMRVYYKNQLALAFGLS